MKKKMTKKKKMKKTRAVGISRRMLKRNKVRHCAAHVGGSMKRMNFGYVVILVKRGSTASV